MLLIVLLSLIQGNHGLFKFDNKSTGISPLRCFSYFYSQVWTWCCLFFWFLFLSRDNLFEIFEKGQKNLVFLWLLLFFLTPLNRFSLVDFSLIRFTLTHTHTLFYIHLCWWWFCNKIEKFTNFYYILFVYLNIWLIIRWIFSDFDLCYSIAIAMVWNINFIIFSFHARFISRRNFLKPTYHSFPRIS